MAGRSTRVIVGCSCAATAHFEQPRTADPQTVGGNNFGRELGFRIERVLAGDRKVLGGIEIPVAIGVVAVLAQRAQPLLQFRVPRGRSVGVRHQVFPPVRMLAAPHHALERRLGVRANRGGGIAHGFEQRRAHLHPNFVRQVSLFGPRLQRQSQVQAARVPYGWALVLEAVHPKGHDGLARHFGDGFRDHGGHGGPYDLHRLRLYGENGRHEVLEEQARIALAPVEQVREGGADAAHHGTARILEQLPRRLHQVPERLGGVVPGGAVEVLGSVGNEAHEDFEGGDAALPVVGGALFNESNQVGNGAFWNLVVIVVLLTPVGCCAC